MNKKVLIYSIITVLFIGLIISSSTYAYFMWTSGTDDKSSVNVTIEQPGITMHIEPENKVISGLIPTDDCNTSNAYFDTLVTVNNETGAYAVPSFKLKVRVTKGGSEELTQEALSHIHYRIVSANYQNQVPYFPGCDAHELYAFDDWSPDDPYLFDSVFTNHLMFESVNTDGSWTHIPNTGDSTYFKNSDDTDDSFSIITSSPAYLPRFYIYEGFETEENYYELSHYGGVTFAAEPHKVKTHYFRVYVWIDKKYTYTNVGNTISDPLQNAKIEVTWSEQSTIQQTSG